MAPPSNGLRNLEAGSLTCVNVRMLVDLLSNPTESEKRAEEAVARSEQARKERGDAPSASYEEARNKVVAATEKLLAEVCSHTCPVSELRCC